MRQRLQRKRQQMTKIDKMDEIEEGFVNVTKVIERFVSNLREKSNYEFPTDMNTLAFQLLPIMNKYNVNTVGHTLMVLLADILHERQFLENADALINPTNSTLQ